MARKLLMAFMLCAVYHFGLIGAPNSSAFMNHLNGKVDGQSNIMGPVASNGHGGLAFLRSKSGPSGNPSLTFGKTHKLMHMSSLRTSHFTPLKAMLKSDGGYGEDDDHQQQKLSPNKIYKFWLYHNVMEKFRQIQQDHLHIIFMEKLADLKGINAEQRMRDPNWFYRIHYIEMPRNDVMKALAESLVEYVDMLTGQGLVAHSYLTDEILKEDDFMKAIDAAILKLLAKKKAEKNDMTKIALNRKDWKRIASSKQAYDQLTRDKIYNLSLYHNTMDMFRQDQKNEIFMILSQKLAQKLKYLKYSNGPLDRHDLNEIPHDIFEVALAETLVEYLFEIDTIESFTTENFSIYMVVKFMADNGVESQKQQVKFIKSFLHLYQEHSHVQIEAKLKAAFEDYEKDE